MGVCCDTAIASKTSSKPSISSSWSREPLTEIRILVSVTSHLFNLQIAEVNKCHCGPYSIFAPRVIPHILSKCYSPVFKASLLKLPDQERSHSLPSY
jgi:hypothetical protein